MSVGDWDIFSHMDRLRQELDRMSPAFSGRLAAHEQEQSWVPAVDIHETEESFVIAVDLPAVNREDIDLQVDSDTLTIRGERKASPEGRTLRLERPAGRFERSFRIGVPIEPERVEATYRSGVLQVSIPKASIKGPARVRIDVE
jgi:HSP20 family protein